MSQKERHLVATFGIPDFERQILDRIFRLSSARAQTYSLAEEGEPQSADIAVVDPGTQKALAEWRSALTQRPDMRTVKVVPDEQSDASPSFSRPFLATRVLTVLDGLLVEGGEEAPNLPSEEAVRQGNPPAHQQPAATGSARSSYRALVVDDSRMIRTQVGLALQDADVEVEYAESGEKALEKIDGQAFDIIFLDVLMTGLDGYEVCKTIKRDRARRQIPVVMLTSQSSPFDKIKGKFSGCDAYLTKPVRREEFQKTLDQYLVKALASD